MQRAHDIVEKERRGVELREAEKVGKSLCTFQCIKIEGQVNWLFQFEFQIDIQLNIYHAEYFFNHSKSKFMLRMNWKLPSII